jgi:chorismate mutase
VPQSKTKIEAADPAAEAQIEEEVAYLSKRHRVSPAIVREIIRRISTSERSAVEREIRKGMARR